MSQNKARSGSPKATVRTRLRSNHERSLREFCVNQLCTVLHGDAS